MYDDWSRIRQDRKIYIDLVHLVIRFQENFQVSWYLGSLRNPVAQVHIQSTFDDTFPKKYMYIIYKMYWMDFSTRILGLSRKSLNVGLSVTLLLKIKKFPDLSIFEEVFTSKMGKSGNFTKTPHAAAFKHSNFECRFRIFGRIVKIFNFYLFSRLSLNLTNIRFYVISVIIYL